MKKELLISAAAAGAAYCVWEANALQTVRHTVDLGLAEPIRIVQLSDLHGKQFGRNNRRLLARVADLEPDLILMTGDTANEDCARMEDTVETVRSLRAIAPVYLIPGNHERRSGWMEEILARFREAGAITLRDQEATLDLRGTSVNILGLAEEYGADPFDYLRAMLPGMRYPDRDDLLRSFSERPGLRLVLCHFPEFFCGIGQRSYHRFGFDLLFAGHAHGGQIRLPGIGGLYAPGQGFFPKYTSGVYGDRPKMIVSRGLGGKSFVPRINNRPEITFVTVI